ncbi:MAG TPA: uracil-DNA glycosylase family protein [Firmicutes bacterium]|nr:uracil-DNA glycosylase family protein [Bacillota bacterium]
MFERYSNEIIKLDSFEKQDLLTETFELYHNGHLKIYYSPHNEIINDKAKILIVGITPGWTQTRIAYQIARDGLRNHLELEEIKKQCKRNSRFAGSMRRNLIEMLDELRLNEKLQLNSCGELFADKDYLLHTTSVIPYPVFINQKNYTGAHPKITEDEVLYRLFRKYFYKEAGSLPDALIIPLGKSVQELLLQMIRENLMKEEQCLLGFPHPSGANGHRKRQFQENKNQLSEKIEQYFHHHGIT